MCADQSDTINKWGKKTSLSFMFMMLSLSGNFFIKCLSVKSLNNLDSNKFLILKQNSWMPGQVQQIRLISKSHQDSGWGFL